MMRAFEEALRGGRAVRPNPLVGCVIVKNNRIISSGYHMEFGGPHAEPLALQKAGSRARGSTLYVSLEPCCIVGKTAACVPAIIKAGIKNVVIAMKDPNPRVNGRGISSLKKAGLNVIMGVGEDKARQINRPFVTWITKKRAHVILKMAQSWDGKIATTAGHSKWISGPQARAWVHRLRADCEAVIIGAQTACHDNPHLTSHGAGRNPVRVILDPTLRSPDSLNVFSRNGQCIVATKVSFNLLKAKKLMKKGVTLYRDTGLQKHINLHSLLSFLFDRDIFQVLVEGGGHTAWQFLNQQVVDEACIVMAPLFIGGKMAPTSVGGDGFSDLNDAVKIKEYSLRSLGHDVVFHGIIR